MKLFVAMLVANVSVGDKAAKIGLVTFDNYNRIVTEFDLNQHNSPGNVIKAVGNIIYTGGSTYLFRALKFVFENSFSFSNMFQPGRDDAKKVLVILTDGKATDSPNGYSEMLRNNNVTIICVGVANADEVQLANIAGNGGFITTVEQFAGLSTIKETIQDQTCKATPL